MKLHGRTLSLSKASHVAARRADMLRKLQKNAGKTLDRLAGIVELAPPQKPGVIRLVYVGGAETRNAAAAHIARIQKTLDCTFDERDTAENVKFSRITLTVSLVFPFEQAQRKAA